MDSPRAPSIPSASARALLLAWAGLGAACYSDDAAVVTSAGATASEATTDGGLSASSTSSGPTSTASEGSSSGESDASTNATTTTNATTDETGGMTTGDASTTGDATSSGEGGCDPDDLPPAFTFDIPVKDLVFTPGGHRMVAVKNYIEYPSDILLLDPCGEVLATLVNDEHRLGQVNLSGDIEHLYYNYGEVDAAAGIRRLDFPRGVTPTQILEGQRTRAFAVDAAEATLVFVGKEEVFRLDLVDPGPPTSLGIAVSGAWVDLALAPDGHALAWFDVLTQEVRVWDFEDFASTLVTTVTGIKSPSVQWLDSDTIAYIGAQDGELLIETFAVPTNEFEILYTSPDTFLNGFQVSPGGDRLVLFRPDVTEVLALP